MGGACSTAEEDFVYVIGLKARQKEPTRKTKT
jgi:hypothetical protein